ncbi:MAG: enoyl-CoA hydratase-related protein [Cupriavidus necator]
MELKLEGLSVQIADGVGQILLDRPEKMNTWSPAMERGLREQLERWSGDPQVRTILLTGRGRAFCAGVDMEALKQASETGGRVPTRARVDGDLAQRYSYMLDVPQPIICALNGAAAGVGVVLALYSDIRIAARSARLAAVFARRGLVAEHGIGWLLPRLIGHARAAEWLISGRTMSAQEAERIGLVARIYDDEDFADAALAYAADIATNCSPRSVRIIKRQLIQGCYVPRCFGGLHSR